MTQQLFGSRLIIIYSVCATNLSTLQYRSPPSRSVSGPVLSQRSEAEGWQPSFSDRSFKKRRRRQPNRLRSSSAYSYSQSHSYSSCLSLAVSHPRWHFTAGMMERRGCVGDAMWKVCTCVRVCACCLMKESQTKMVMFLNVSMVNIKHWCVFGGLLFQLCKTAPLMTLSLRKAKWQQRPETRSMENSDFYLWILNSRNQFSSTI